MQLLEDEIMLKGIKCLIENLGEVETEFFIFNLKRKNFDYTEWQREFFDNNFSLEKFLELAKNLNEEDFKNNPNCKII